MPVDRALYTDETPEPTEDEPRYLNLMELWPTWHTEANCLGEDEAVFFGSSAPDKRPAYTLSSIRRAKAICAGCPVFEPCLRQAIHNREAYGVWASTTMKERSRIFTMLTMKHITEEQAVTAILTREHREYRPI